MFYEMPYEMHFDVNCDECTVTWISSSALLPRDIHFTRQLSVPLIAMSIALFVHTIDLSKHQIIYQIVRPGGLHTHEYMIICNARGSCKLLSNRAIIVQSLCVFWMIINTIMVLFSSSPLKFNSKHQKLFFQLKFHQLSAVERKREGKRERERLPKWKAIRWHFKVVKSLITFNLKVAWRVSRRQCLLLSSRHESVWVEIRRFSFVKSDHLRLERKRVHRRL